MTGDIYSEPDGDPDTPGRLGPLRGLAGVWRGATGSDLHPTVGGGERDSYIEHYEAQPIDFQTNGPQIFYGLRYHTRIVKPGEAPTFHDQVGYWLWEPVEHLLVLTATIPRGQALLASGRCDPEASEFTVEAERGSTVNGIVSNAFLDTSFQTQSFSMTVTVDVPGDRWSYVEHTLLHIAGRPDAFDHVDRHDLVRIGPAVPNPLAVGGTPA